MKIVIFNVFQFESFLMLTYCMLFLPHLFHLLIYFYGWTSTTKGLEPLVQVNDLFYIFNYNI